MENPATWNDIQETIDQALRAHHENMRLHICGYSDVSTIYHALLEKGYLNLEKFGRKTMKIEQLNVGRVLVKPQSAAAAEKTAGGILIPEAYRVEGGGVKTCDVVAVGPLRYDQTGKPTAIEFKVGDKVVIDNLGLVKFKINNDEVYLLRQEDIIGKL